MQTLEGKIKTKLLKVDSVVAKNIFTVTDNYFALEQDFSNWPVQEYYSNLDNISTSLKYIQQNPRLLSEIKNGKQKLKDAMSKINGLEDQLKNAETIKKYLKERKEFLKDLLGKYSAQFKVPFTNELKKMNQQVFYYAAQFKEYKDILNEPGKIEKKTFEMLGKTKVYNDFMKKNSMLFGIKKPYLMIQLFT